MANDSANEAVNGLTEAEVAVRLQQHGYNELPLSKRRSILATAWDVVREPMCHVRSPSFIRNKLFVERDSEAFSSTISGSRRETANRLRDVVVARPLLRVFHHPGWSARRHQVAPKRP
jgi:hypothetical protein